MKRFRKVYLEISNICNLHCNFCPGTKRKKHALTQSEFTELAAKLRNYTDYLYFHLMGEPLCHPLLNDFLTVAGEMGYKVILTTNGSLLGTHSQMLLAAPALHKVNISLHSFEANDLTVPFEAYLANCFRFGKLAEGKCIVTYRLWNSGGKDQRNNEILNTLKAYFPEPWYQERGIRIGNRIYLEHGDKFDWPDSTLDEGTADIFCYGLRDQIGVLCDGTVVPCCLDHEGDIPLGNLFEQSMDEILHTARAQAIYDGFSRHEAVESLCRKCGYARMK